MECGSNQAWSLMWSRAFWFVSAHTRMTFRFVSAHTRMTFRFVSAHTHMTFRFVSAHTRMTFRFVSAHTRMTFRFVTSNTVDDVQYSVILYCMMTFRFIKTFDVVRLITPFVLYGIEVRQCPNAVKHLLCSYCLLIWLKWFMLHLAYGDLQVHQHD